MNNTDNIILIFNKDDDDDTRVKFHTVAIPKQSIIKSPGLYRYFRQNPKSRNFQINAKCNSSFEETIKDIFSLKKSLRKGFINCVNIRNEDFLAESNQFLEIKQLDCNIKNFKHDKDFLNGEYYQDFCQIQNFLQNQDNNDDVYYKNLLAYSDLLNKMKISFNLPSLRNRMKILKRIANIKNNVYFRDNISADLYNEIQKYQNEIESASMIEVNGTLKYKNIIDVIRNDEVDKLKIIIGSYENFDYEILYDFDYDFTNLLPKKATIFEITVYFCAVECYTYLSVSYIKSKNFFKDNASNALKNVPKFAFASGNFTMIEFCRQYNLLEKNPFSTYLEILIAYQNNNLYNWIFDMYKPQLTIGAIRCAANSNNFEILRDLIYDYGADLNIALFQAFDNDNIDMLSVLINLKSSNINYGMEGILIIYFLYTYYSSCLHRRKKRIC